MKWTQRITPAIVLLTLTTACAPADDVDTMDDPAVEPGAVTAPAAPAELEARSDAFGDAWNQDDPNVIAAFFTEDATVRADTATFNGRQEILENWLQPGVEVVGNLSVEGETWEQSGQDYRAAGRFTYTATTPEGESTQTGTYETTWTRGTDGQWYVSAMTSMADPAPATTTGQ
jgi:ketosteroid isomerase-like protein